MTQLSVKLNVMEVAGRLTVRGRDEQGSMAVEVVLMTPVLFMFALLVVVAGRYVDVIGDAEAASRDAARAASMARTQSEAEVAAANAAAQGLEPELDCSSTQVGGAFVAGGTVTVTLTCEVSYENLGLIGLNGAADIEATSSAPLETYRRTG